MEDFDTETEPEEKPSYALFSLAMLGVSTMMIVAIMSSFKYPDMPVGKYIWIGFKSGVLACSVVLAIVALSNLFGKD